MTDVGQALGLDAARDLDKGERRGRVTVSIEERLRATRELELMNGSSSARSEAERDLKSKLATVFAFGGLSVEASFKRFDSDGDGAVSSKEFADGLASLGAKLEPQEVEMLVRLLDADGDGVVDYVEFARWFGLEPVVATFSEQGALGLKFQQDSNGKVSVLAIQPGTQAARAGGAAKGTALRVGLVLESVGKHATAGLDLDSCMRLLSRQQQRPLTLRFSQPEVVVTFEKEGSLGLKFADYCPGQVEVSAIAPHSQAEEHVQLQVGLVLVAVGGVEVSGMSFEQAVATIANHQLRPLTLRFHRLADEVAIFEDPGPLGLRFQTRANAPGQIEVSKIVPGSAAARMGWISPGLVLMRVGMEAVTGYDLDKCVATIQNNLQRPLTLRFNYPVDTASHQETDTGARPGQAMVISGRGTDHAERWKFRRDAVDRKTRRHMVCSMQDRRSNADALAEQAKVM